ncbi:endonuclease III [Boudabousia liubingyangii]|uniref:Endonuclease III n=1 Tax=Boudabousia liubingyangii TaxID=1921764 RepID=A0A1Q5PPQ1_9ACTO|nr:endonuclease III [Boudabousia liubingyangii]OKL48468.1 endonuclease III [Boudabousia liubingyangii]OKL49503.1 endonuclease III [Boudabousia liubingyangii]
MTSSQKKTEPTQSSKVKKGVEPAPSKKAELFAELQNLYPNASCALQHEGPFQLLVATVLSAQTTDQRVNQITPALFEKYPDPESLAAGDPEDLLALVKPLGFGNRRSSQLKKLGDALVHEYQGSVPETSKALETLPGVGRKTANVVLGNCFGQPAITVDTHVGRLARRWGWTKETDPKKAELDIQQVLPKETWTKACHQIIDHGRAICHSRQPDCGNCPLWSLCPQIGVHE